MGVERNSKFWNFTDIRKDFTQFWILIFYLANSLNGKVCVHLPPSTPLPHMQCINLNFPENIVFILQRIFSPNILIRIYNIGILPSPRIYWLLCKAFIQENLCIHSPDFSFIAHSSWRHVLKFAYLSLSKDVHSTFISTYRFIFLCIFTYNRICMFSEYLHWLSVKLVITLLNDITIWLYIMEHCASMYITQIENENTTSFHRMWLNAYCKCIWLKLWSDFYFNNSIKGIHISKTWQMC